VLFASNYLRCTEPGKLTEAFSSFDKDLVVPGSFWMKKVG
jgi:hypothetical protein